MRRAVRLLLGGGALGRAFTLLSAARSRRVDMVMIGDSHQNQNGNGYDDGFGRSLARKFGLYATAPYVQEIGGTSLSTSGFATNGISGVTNSAVTGADAGLDQFKLPSNLPYCYQASGDMGQFNGVYLVDDADGLNVNANLRAHYCYATFNSGSGSWLGGARIETTPFTTLANTGTVNTNTGAFGQTVKTLDLAAGARSQDISFRWRLGGVAANVGPTLERWLRVENRDRTAGISVSTLYGVPSQSLYDMAAYLIAETDQALTNYFTAIRYLQVQSGLAPLVVVYVCSGHNDRSEASTPSLGPNPVAGPTSSAAYLDNLQAIVNRVSAIWALNGWDQAGLSFLAIPSHPDSDDVLVDGYRKAVKQWCRTRPYASTIDYSTLTSYTEINGNSWFLSPPHLTLTGYETLASRAAALIA